MFQDGKVLSLMMFSNDFPCFFPGFTFFPGLFCWSCYGKAMAGRWLPGQSEGAEGATVVNLVRRKEQVAILDAGTDNSLDWFKGNSTGNQWFLLCFYH